MTSRGVPFVEVEWLDAWASAAEDFDVAVHHKPWENRTRGWLVRDDESGVSVSPERSPKAGGGWVYRGHTFVPRALVVKVRKTR
jgi:hypothetical protein